MFLIFFSNIFFYSNCDVGGGGDEADSDAVVNYVPNL